MNYILMTLLFAEISYAKVGQGCGWQNKNTMCDGLCSLEGVCMPNKKIYRSKCQSHASKALCFGDGTCGNFDNGIKKFCARNHVCEEGKCVTATDHLGYCDSTFSGPNACGDIQCGGGQYCPIYKPYCLSDSSTTTGYSCQVDAPFQQDCQAFSSLDRCPLQVIPCGELTTSQHTAVVNCPKEIPYCVEKYNPSFFATVSVCQKEFNYRISGQTCFPENSSSECPGPSPP
eukprot:NODE_45_length_32908_cov_0.790271.p20 type:complete len:230 gc:universal NODE_45_length_32908_cov_0.790271:26349-27038(+)